jgi:hypothetical protein
MTSPITCCGKITFLTKEDALAMVAQLPADYPSRDEVKVYDCRYGAWHTTSHYNESWTERRPVGELVLQTGRAVICPWCGRKGVLVARGRVLSGHRDTKYKDMPICLGAGKPVKYDRRGTVVKDNARVVGSADAYDGHIPPVDSKRHTRKQKRYK